MKERIRWLFFHAAHWAVLYGAFVAQLDGAMYVLKFWVWLMAPLSLFLLTDTAAADGASKPWQPVRHWLIMLQAWATLGLLVWFGHIASALAWGMVMVVCAVHRDNIRKARAAAAMGEP